MRDTKKLEIGSLALFAEATGTEIAWIARIADVIDVEAGAVIAQAGRMARQFFVVLDGAATSGDVVLGPGAFYGESALECDGVEPRTVETLLPTRLLVFGTRQFRSLVDRVPSVRRKILASLATRLRDYDERSLRAVS